MKCPPITARTPSTQGVAFAESAVTSIEVLMKYTLQIMPIFTCGHAWDSFPSSTTSSLMRNGSMPRRDYRALLTALLSSCHHQGEGVYLRYRVLRLRIEVITHRTHHIPVPITCLPDHTTRPPPMRLPARLTSFTLCALSQT